MEMTWDMGSMERRCRRKHMILGGEVPASEAHCRDLHATMDYLRRTSS